MPQFKISKRIENEPVLSDRGGRLIRKFGLSPKSKSTVIVKDCTIKVNPSEIVYLTGASGTGKTVMFNELKRRITDCSIKCIDLADLEIPRNKPLIDCFGDLSLSESLYYLSMAGLSEVNILLRRPERLSVGERFRFSLALALVERADVIMADEFCSSLDRITARVAAYNIRRLVDRFGVTFIVATSHDDLLFDLAADVVAIKRFGPACDVYEFSISDYRQMRI